MANRTIGGINEQARSDAERAADREIEAMQREREGLPPLTLYAEQKQNCVHMNGGHFTQNEARLGVISLQIKKVVL